MMIKLLLFFVTVLSAVDPWEKVREVFLNQTLVDNVALTVAREKRLFEVIKGNITLETPVSVASSSKMVGGLPAMQLLVEGKMKLSDPVSKYLPYWTTDKNDLRSGLLIEHLLTFRSGFHSSVPGGEGLQCRAKTISECVKQIYERAEVGSKWQIDKPGDIWAYNSLHLQILGAVTEAVAGKDIQTLLNETMGRIGMESSYWFGDGNPMLAGDLVTTGNDYEKFMIAYFNGKSIPLFWTYVMEALYNPPPTVEPKDEIDWVLGAFVGGYSMLNWLECSVNPENYPSLRDECIKANVHSDPGLFGFWPLYDRKLDYHMQLVLMGEVAVGTVDAQFLRLLIKPYVDAAITGIPTDINDKEHYEKLEARWREHKKDGKLLKALGHLGKPSYMLRK